MAKPSAIQRFVLIAHPRSGSTWLTHGLSEHDDILMFGEVFNAEPEDRARAVWEGLRYEPGVPSPPAGYTPPGSTAAFAEHLFSLADVTGHNAVGFKIHYGHAWGNRSWNSVWKLIASDPGIAIIHLHRKDLLRSYVSMLIALANDEWVATRRHPGSKRKNVRVYVDIPSFRTFVRHCLRFKLRLEHYRNNHPFLDLEYESAVALHPLESYRAICDTLGQPRANPHNYYIKQKDFAIEEVVTNYPEALACWRSLTMTS